MDRGLPEKEKAAHSHPGVGGGDEVRTHHVWRLLSLFFFNDTFLSPYYDIDFFFHSTFLTIYYYIDFFFVVILTYHRAYF